MKPWLWVLLLLVLLPAQGHARVREEVLITVASSQQSKFVTNLLIKPASGWGDRIASAKSVPAAAETEWPRATLRVGQKTYVWDWNGRLTDESGSREFIVPPSVREEIEKHVALAERAHYGKAVAWKEVKNVFRRMSYAWVVDLETGESFRVQRRAGSRHADVQPVTREDTAIMKRIYRGKWSWKRRAILVKIDGHTYAASMNGMPHGAGAIRGNDFPGHFCIHFQGSSTHRRRTPDPAHSLMILKSSGELREVLKNADPREVTDTFLIALHEGDRELLAMVADADALPFAPDELEYVRRDGPVRSEVLTDLMTAEVTVSVKAIRRGQPRTDETWHVLLRRLTPIDRWKIAEVNRLH